MGLYMHAYSKMDFVHKEAKCFDDDHISVSSLDKFIERLDGREQGCYICKGKEREVFMVAYPCYDDWRRLLSRAALKAPVENILLHLELEENKDEPFFALLCMSGMEGAFGPVTSKKLVEDFKTHSRSIKKIIPELIQENGFYPWDDKKVALEQWLYMYSSLQKAFSLASNAGFVILW